MQEADESLMVRVGQGDTDAFRTIVHRYEAKARRFCYRMFRDVQIAEDAAQEGFLKLFRTADKYEPTGRFQTYFYRVLGNLCFDRLRFEKRRAVVRGTPADGMTLDGHEDGAGSGGNGRFLAPDEALRKKEERQAVRKALLELPENPRQALILREFDGLKYREIAEVMGVSLNDVKVLIHRGRKMLAGRLAKVLTMEKRP